jgi:hypothetical protein
VVEEGNSMDENADDYEKGDTPEVEESPVETSGEKPTPIIICPTFTKETILVAFAADQMNRWFIEHGFTTKYLSEFRARKPLLFRETKLNRKFRNEPSLILYYGHGKDDSWVGIESFKNRLIPRLRLVADGVNPDWLASGNYIYAISCYTANRLGRSMVNKYGALLYGGSKERVNFDLYSSVNDDDMIYDFVEVFNSFPIALASGLTVGDSVEVFFRTIDGYLKRYEDSGEIETNKLMRNQYYGLRIIRDNFVFIPKNKGILDRKWYDATK